MLSTPFHFLPITSPRPSTAGHQHFPTIPSPPSSFSLCWKTRSKATTTARALDQSWSREHTPDHYHDLNYEDQESISAYWDYQFLFISQRSSSTEPVSLPVVDGAIPPDFPSGTYYLAGPGIFSDDVGSTVHPLDGHGYLRAFDFDGASGEARFSARYVETAALSDEHDGESGRWRFSHRGPFSVLRGGHMLGNTRVMKNVANTSVLKWRGHLLCLWEGGLPYEINEATLDTIGEFDLAGSTAAGKLSSGAGLRLPELGIDLAASFLKPILHGLFKMPEKRLLSHYKIDAKRERLLMVSCNAEDMVLPRSNFIFYEFSSDFRLLNRREFTIPDHLMIHDWAFTDAHYVIIGNRIKLDIPGSFLAALGLSPMITSLSVDARRPSTPVYLLPRFSDDQAAESRLWEVPIEAPSQEWFLHVGNAFEEKDEKSNLEINIYAAACSYHWFNFHKMFGYDWQTGKLDPSFMNAKEGEETKLPHLVKVSIRLNSDRSPTKCDIEPLHQWTRPSDFPAINPSFSGSINKYIYAGTSSGRRRSLPHFPFDSIVKVDVEDGSATMWSTKSRRFVGEPIFVPKGTEEDDGYLLVVEYAVAIQRCYLVVLDPRRIGQQEAFVARLEVPKHLNFPLGFHGLWSQKS